MKKANVISSIEKWEKAIEKLKAEEDPEIMSRCGFCAEFMVRADCGKCPLSTEFCSNFENGTKVFWKIYFAVIADDYKLALELSEKLLAKIKTYLPEAT